MNECVDGPWSKQFLCVLATPQTAVDVVLASAAAVLAAVVAIVVLRRQLVHDREVLNKQFQREAAVTRASFQRPYLDQLGNALIDFGSALDGETSDAVGILALKRGDYPGTHEFHATWDRLEAFTELPQPNVTTNIWRDVSHYWRWCQQFANNYIKNDTNEETLTACGLAADTVYAKPASRAKALGAAILQWDGISTLDLSNVFDGWERVDPRDKPAYQQLHSMAEAEFVRVLRKYVKGDTQQEVAVRQRLANVK